MGSARETRFGWDQDRAVRVELTNPKEEYCFRLHFGDNTVDLHGRGLADLIHKANAALLVWIGEQAVIALGDAAQFLIDPDVLADAKRRWSGK